MRVLELTEAEAVLLDAAFNSRFSGEEAVRVLAARGYTFDDVGTAWFSLKQKIAAAGLLAPSVLA